MNVINMFANCLIELLMLLTITIFQLKHYNFIYLSQFTIHLSFFPCFYNQDHRFSNSRLRENDYLQKIGLEQMYIVIILFLENILQYTRNSKYQIMEATRKYHKIWERSSQTEAAKLINFLIDDSHLKYFSNNVMSFYKQEMAKQIVTAESESIQQIRSSLPRQPPAALEDQKPVKKTFDSYRPYSAKVERIRKVQICNQIESNKISKRVSSNKTLQTAKSLKSVNHIVLKGREQKSEFKKYKSKLIPLINNHQEDEQCDKIIQQLRKNKLKAEEYEKGKQNFLVSVKRQSQDYQKRRQKFMSAMPRKQYTYTYNCQVVEIQKPKQAKKRMSVMKPNINIAAKKNEEQQRQKPQQIFVEFAKKQLRAQLKDFIFTNSADVKAESICPQSTAATKFAVVIQDC